MKDISAGVPVFKEGQGSSCTSCGDYMPFQGLLIEAVHRIPYKTFIERNGSSFKYYLNLGIVDRVSAELHSKENALQLHSHYL